jgi:hypothetical protein
MEKVPAYASVFNKVGYSDGCAVLLYHVSPPAGLRRGRYAGQAAVTSAFSSNSPAARCLCAAMRFVAGLWRGSDAGQAAAAPNPPH